MLLLHGKKKQDGRVQAYCQLESCRLCFLQFGVVVLAGEARVVMQTGGGFPSFV